MSQTMYDVGLAYSVRDGASAGLLGIGRAATDADRATSGLSATFGKLAGVVGAAAALHKAKGAFVDFNAEIENSKISIAAVHNMFSGGSFANSMSTANEVFAGYQEAAKASTATTKDFLEMHKAIAPVMTQSGASMKMMMDIVKGATVAAPIFGVDAGMLAIDIRQMMQGAVGNKDLANIMISSMGLDRDAFNKKARQSVGFAMDTVSKALTSPSIKAAALSFEGSFSGVTSTLEDTLQILGGQAGAPLFKTVTQEIRQWNEWLEKNKASVEVFTARVGDGLVTGFHAVRDAMSFIVEHQDALLMVAGAYGAAKTGGAILSTANQIGSGVGFVRTGLQLGAGLGGGGAAGLASSFGASALAFATSPATIAAVAGAVVAYGGYQLYRASQDAAQHAAKIDPGGVGVAAVQRHADVWGAIRGSDSQAQALAMQSGFLGSGGLNEAGAQAFALRFATSTAQANEMMDRFRAVASRLPQDAMIMADMFEMANRRFKQPLAEMADMTKAYLHGWSGGLLSFGSHDAPGAETKPKSVKRESINVTIQRVEVASNDPDRFVVGLAKAAERALTTRTQASTARLMR